MMKKNGTLYKVNKYNRPMFMPEENLFPNGGNTGVNVGGDAWNKAAFNSDPLGYVTAVSQGFDPVAAYKSSKNWLGLSKEDNPFSKGNLMNTFSKENLSNMGSAALTGLAAAGAGMLGNKVAGAISGGLSSGTGNFVRNVGGAALSTAGGLMGGPLGAAAGEVVAETLGGVVDAFIGEKEDTAKLNRVKADINKLKNYNYANDLDSMQQRDAVSMDTHVYDGGIFNDVSDKNDALKKELMDALAYADRSFDNNAKNLISDQLNQALANSTAFGGPIEINDGMGALEYDILTTRKKSPNNKNQMTNMFMGMPDSMFAFGGDMQTNSADFPTGLTHINAGGSHEENVNDGVQMGVDNEGTPNLVEEGETVYNDYVFSNRILADEATKQMFRLPKKKDITFADISKKLEKEIAERPNDPISKAGFEAQMQTLEEQQERQKSEMEAERARAAFEALSPEEQTAVMQNAAQQEAMAQQAAEEQAIAEQQAMQQPSPKEAAMMQQQEQVSPEEQLAQIQANVSALGGQLVKASDIEPQSNKFAIGGRKAKKTAQKYNKEWFSQMAKALGISDEEMSKFTFNSADPDANLSAFNQIYRDSQYNKALETYKAGQRQSKRNELFGDRGLYRMSDDGKKVYKAKTNSAARDGWISVDYRGQDSFEDNLEHGRYISDEKYQKLSDEEKGKYRRIHEKAGDKMYDFNGKLLEEVQPEGTTADNILDEYDADYNKGFKWEDKDAQTLQYPVGMEHSDESYLRYVPFLGGTIGLFNDLFSSPDYSRAEGIQKAGQITPMMVKSNFNPTYMTYRPLDIWYGQNALNAQSRATDRALLNSSSPSRMAGLIANGYNSQLASGNLFRQAQEYNDALKKQVITHNSGENKTSAQLDMQGQLANQRAVMEAGMHNARYKTFGYQMMDDIDARRNASMNANLTNVLQSIGNIGEEAYDTDRLRWLERTGVLKSKTLGANGGKLTKKKKGLTY